MSRITRVHVHVCIALFTPPLSHTPVTLSPSFHCHSHSHAHLIFATLTPPSLALFTSPSLSPLGSSVVMTSKVPSKLLMYLQAPLNYPQTLVKCIKRQVRFLCPALDRDSQSVKTVAARPPSPQTMPLTRAEHTARAPQSERCPLEGIDVYQFTIQIETI